jgi:hypothetical protein
MNETDVVRRVQAARLKSVLQKICTTCCLGDYEKNPFAGADRVIDRRTAELYDALTESLGLTPFACCVAAPRQVG